MSRVKKTSSGRWLACTPDEEPTSIGAVYTSSEMPSRLNT